MTARDPQHDFSGDPRLRLRILFGPDAMMGPGKADLLEHIGKTGSIAAAGRAMGMSYKRAWSLIHEMNQMFCAPLVVTSRGGPKGGGAELTAMGLQVLTHFRAIERILTKNGAEDLARLNALLRDQPK